MLVRQHPGFLLNFLANAEEVSEDLLEVAKMLLHALSLSHLQLVELPPEEESVGKRLRHV